MAVYRVYTNDDSFLSLKDACIEGEIHVVLAFARDYDNCNKSTNGKFVTCFNNQKVTPEVIKQFKCEAKVPVKFYLSIGGRSNKYPFSVDCATVHIWKKNAIDSLKRIIKDYNFDGIDVYYQHIAPSSPFTDAIGSVLKELRDSKVVTVASIATSSNTNKVMNNYIELHKEYSTYINNVVYHTHFEPYVTGNAATLQGYLKNLPNSYKCPNLLAGHSILLSDWFTVSHPIFYIAVKTIQDKVISGISIWTVLTDTL